MISKKEFELIPISSICIIGDSKVIQIDGKTVIDISTVYVAISPLGVVA